MERKKLISVVSGAVLLIILIVYGGYTIKTKINSLQEQVTQQTQRGDELATTLSDTTKELSSKGDELEALQEQYGVAVTDKEKAETEASTQKKAAASSASEAKKQKDIADTASLNYYYAVQAGAAVEDQRDYYSSATWYVADGVEKMGRGDYSGASRAFQYATALAGEAQALNSTVNYWIGLIE